MSTQTDSSQGIGAAVNYLKGKCEVWTKDTPGAKVEVYRSEAGGPAMRMDRTHQYVREENGIAYGDLIQGVDIPYLQRNIQVNLASVMNLAQAPAAPARARIANAGALSNSTILEWTAVQEDGVTYQVLYRETDQPEWQVYAECPASPEKTLSYEVPLSKDNYFYAVRSISAGGHPSLPVVCR